MVVKSLTIQSLKVYYVKEMEAVFLAIKKLIVVSFFFGGGSLAGN